MAWLGRRQTAQRLGLAGARLPKQLCRSSKGRMWRTGASQRAPARGRRPRPLRLRDPRLVQCSLAAALVPGSRSYVATEVLPAQEAAAVVVHLAPSLRAGPFMPCSGQTAASAAEVAAVCSCSTPPMRPSIPGRRSTGSLGPRGAARVVAHASPRTPRASPQRQRASCAARSWTILAPSTRSSAASPRTPGAKGSSGAASMPAASRSSGVEAAAQGARNAARQCLR
mmetsp:Transcript_94720/g.282887  ORF Transcript_94720/g.282887 Transcript_94720/m.282887 type:complete len:226 (+) Transcript_94720:168-845(+)